MNIYRQLIENPLFYKWIYHPSPEINNYWEHYLQNHSENAALIREFKAGFEAHLSYVDHRLSYEEKEELAIKIIKQLELQQKNNKRHRIVRFTLRYAAVAVVFLLIGGALSYIIQQKQQADQMARIPPPVSMNIQEPTLILDDKEEIALKRGESNVEYSDKGEIIVDNKQIAGEKEVEKEVEKIKMNTLVIPYGNRSTITLADGTQVWLNAGSRMIYPSRFIDRKREVFLVGEAFFNVTKNQEKPFIVKTPDIEIEVLGTQFNLSAYPEENVVQAVLTEGSIELGWTNGGLFDRSTKIVPGQMAMVNREKRETKLYNVNTEYYTSWREGYLTFNNSDLSRVVKKLERYYNIRFRYEDPLNGSIKISGKLDVTSDKEVVFKYMNSLTGLNFTKINATNYLIK